MRRIVVIALAVMSAVSTASALTAAAARGPTPAFLLNAFKLP